MKIEEAKQIHAGDFIEVIDGHEPVWAHKHGPYKVALVIDEETIIVFIEENDLSEVNSTKEGTFNHFYSWYSTFYLSHKELMPKIRPKSDPIFEHIKNTDYSVLRLFFYSIGQEAQYLLHSVKLPCISRNTENLTEDEKDFEKLKNFFFSDLTKPYIAPKGSWSRYI